MHRELPPEPREPITAEQLATGRGIRRPLQAVPSAVPDAQRAPSPPAPSMGPPPSVNVHPPAAVEPAPAAPPVSSAPSQPQVQQSPAWQPPPVFQAPPPPVEPQPVVEVPHVLAVQPGLLPMPTPTQPPEAGRSRDEILEILAGHLPEGDKELVAKLLRFAGDNDTTFCHIRRVITAVFE